MEQCSGYSAAWSSAFDWGSKGPEFESPYPDHFFAQMGKKHEAVRLRSYERLFVKFYLRKNRKKVDNQRKMILKSCFCLAPIRVL